MDKLFASIYDYSNLLLAWKKTQRLRKYNQDIIFFRKNLDENLIIIQNELIWKSYKVSEYQNFVIYEPKKRLISALPVKDRIVQHALVNIIEPVIDRKFIFDSHACRKGHGLKLAVDRFIKFAKKNKYCLKCDIASYFPSINHVVLKLLYRRHISCDDTLWLIDRIIDSTENPGLPIGNLLSQLSANLYLHELDFYVKHQLKLKYYIRYMDDFVVFDNNYQSLIKIKDSIRDFLQNHLLLNLKEEKSKIHETKNGVDYCGFRCYPSHAVVKKETRIRNYKRITQLANGLKNNIITPDDFLNSLTSIIGHSMYSRNYSYRKNIIDIFYKINI
ncbi:MAG: reverse transcriptase/maturase family protein [Spirochaetota bacterium]